MSRNGTAFGGFLWNGVARQGTERHSLWKEREDTERHGKRNGTEQVRDTLWPYLGVAGELEALDWTKTNVSARDRFLVWIQKTHQKRSSLTGGSEGRSPQDLETNVSFKKEKMNTGEKQ